MYRLTIPNDRELSGVREAKDGRFLTLAGGHHIDGRFREAMRTWLADKFQCVIDSPYEYFPLERRPVAGIRKNPDPTFSPLQR